MYVCMSNNNYILLDIHTHIYTHTLDWVSGTFHHLCRQPSRWQTSPGCCFFPSSFFGERARGGGGGRLFVWGLSSGPEPPLFWQRLVDWPPVQLMSTNEIRDGMCEGIIIVPVAAAIRVLYSSLHTAFCVVLPVWPDKAWPSHVRLVLA